MDLENKITEEIEEEESINESEQREKREINIKRKTSSLVSSSANNDENINNMNKEAKRIESFSSFGLKAENSKNSTINNDTSSENYKNKEFENSMEKKLSKKKPLKGSIQFILSEYLLEIILRNKEDMNIIFKKQQYKNLLDDMKKSNNYFDIYSPIQESDQRNLNELLFENKNYITKPKLKSNLASFGETELEFYKFGKKIKNPIRKRYGILTNTDFYSSNDPIASYKIEKSKKKTKYIFNAKEIIKEEYNEIKEKKEKWHNEVKKYRIRINYMNDKGQMNYFLIYFFEEKERDFTLDLIKLIKLNMTMRDKADRLLKNMEKILIQKNKLYFILKVLLIKRKIKNKAKIKNYLNKDLKKDKNEFDIFIRSIKNNIKGKYLEQRKLLCNKGIQRINKCLFLNKEFLKNQKDLNDTRDYNLSDIKKACNTIYNAIKKSYYFHNNKIKKNDLILFKTKIPKNSDQYNKESNLCFNYKNICINKVGTNISNHNEIFMDKNNILEISSIIYNLKIPNSKDEEKEEYKIAILGPYHNEEKHRSTYFNNFSYDLNISEYETIKNISNKYIYQDNEVFYVICQIFNIEINKSDFKNYSFISSITQNDSFYLKIIGGFDNNLVIKTRIFNPKFIKDYKIVFELNIELCISYEFFDNKDRAINIILYKINQNKIKDFEKNMLYLDYISQIEIKKVILKLDSFINVSSYEMLFNECNKSKIFWNLIIYEKNDNNTNIKK